MTRSAPDPLHRADVQTATRRLDAAPCRRSTTSLPVRIPTQADEHLVQLLELLAPSTRAPGGDGFVESFLRGIEVVHHQQRLAVFLLERRRGDGPVTFVVGPDEARIQRQFEVLAEERHLGALMAEHQPVRATDTNVQLAGEQRQAERLWYPPTFEQLGLGERFEH